MQSSSAQWTQQFIRYVFSKVIELLEQNIQKQIDCTRPSNTKQINWIQNIQIECGNIKLSNVLKYNQLNLVLSVFGSS